MSGCGHKRDRLGWIIAISQGPPQAACGLTNILGPFLLATRRGQRRKKKRRKGPKKVVLAARFR